MSHRALNPCQVIGFRYLSTKKRPNSPRDLESTATKDQHTSAAGVGDCPSLFPPQFSFLLSSPSHRPTSSPAAGIDRSSRTPQKSRFEAVHTHRPYPIQIPCPGAFGSPSRSAAADATNATPTPLDSTANRLKYHLLLPRARGWARIRWVPADSPGLLCSSLLSPCFLTLRGLGFYRARSPAPAR